MLAGIDHVNILVDVARNQMRGAALAMTHDKHVGLHCRQIGDCIEHRLTLALRGNINGKVDYIRR